MPTEEEIGREHANEHLARIDSLLASETDEAVVAQLMAERAKWSERANGSTVVANMTWSQKSKP
jgi:hypothetical protein